MSFTVNQSNQRQAIMGTIMSLMQDLQQLAPHPDQPQNNGPLFIKSNPNFKAANDHDGMLGSMILESILGTAFLDAVSETFGDCAQNFDAASALECYSEYITDVEGSAQQKAAHGQGTLARLSGKSISSSFNMRGAISPEMQSFMDDMPTRMKVERDLAYCAQQLEMIDAQRPEYETAQQRFAA